MLYFQSLLYFILLYMEAEDSMLVTQYVTFLQPVMVISILLGIYSLTVTTKTLHTAVPGNECDHLKILLLNILWKIYSQYTSLFQYLHTYN